MNDFKMCIDFANEVRVSFFATVEGDQPRVRALGFWFADKTGFYFQTGEVKALYRQLKANPKTEVCFYEPGANAGTMLRVTGEAEFVDDMKLKERLLEDMPFLKDLGFTVHSSGLIIFRIPHGQAHFWTMKTSYKPKEIISF